MKAHHTQSPGLRGALVIAGALVWLAACGIDRGGITVQAPTTTPAPAASKAYVGPVESVQPGISITVNGSQLALGSASGTRNGAMVLANTLAQGDLISASAFVNDNGALELTSFELNQAVLGPITAVGTNGLEIMGVEVRVSAATVIPAGFAALAVNDVYAVSGYRNSDGSIAATRIAPDPATEFLLTGTLASLQVDSLLAGIQLPNVPAGVVSVFRATGSGLTQDGFLATQELAALGPFPLTDFSASFADSATEFSVQGPVSMDPISGAFSVGGVSLVIDAATDFVGGDNLDLVDDALVVAEGLLGPDLSLTAVSIRFVAPPSPFIAASSACRRCANESGRSST